MSVVSDSVLPHRRQPTRLLRPWDSPGKTLEWVAISFSNTWKWKVKVKSLSPVRLLETPWTAAHQAPPPMGFSRQEYWSGVPLPSLRIFEGDSIQLAIATDCPSDPGILCLLPNWTWVHLPNVLQSQSTDAQAPLVMGVAESLISPWTVFWLAGSDILGISIIDLFVPTTLGSVCWWSACS